MLNTSICQISPDTSPHVVLLVCPTNSLLTDQAERLQERGLEPLVIGSKASNLSGLFKYYSYVTLGFRFPNIFHHNSKMSPEVSLVDRYNFRILNDSYAVVACAKIVDISYLEVEDLQ